MWQATFKKLFAFSCPILRGKSTQYEDYYLESGHPFFLNPVLKSIKMIIIFEIKITEFPNLQNQSS